MESSDQEVSVGPLRFPWELIASDSDEESSSVISGRGTKRTASEVDKESDNEATPVEIPPKKKMKRKECITCSNNVAINRFPKSPHKGAQVHDRGVCFECWEQHLETEIESKAWNAVSCAQCAEHLEEPEIRKLASSAAYSKWLEKATKAFLDGEDSFRSCPSASCKNGGYLNGGYIFTCQACSFRYCFACNVPMHEDEACSAYQERQAESQRKADREAENAASERIVSGSTKPCPNCKFRINKVSGCDHMTCIRCKHEFCWLCFSPYGGEGGIAGTQGNYAHAQTCMYHPTRLPNVPPGFD